MSLILSITPVIANVLNVVTFMLGSLFIADPCYVLGFLGDESDTSQDPDSDGHQNESLQETLSKLVGGLLIAFTVTVFSVGKSLDGDKCKKHRITLSSHSMLGLIILLLGLLGDVNQTIGFVGVGSVIVLLGCIGLMTSFYPFYTTDAPQETSRTTNVGSTAADERPENMVPLLEDASRDIETAGDADNGVGSIQNDQTQQQLQVPPAQNEVESRIKGTKRLIKLAGPHTFYLYAGCIVLLIRLPFSLSIPHFVSATLAACARADFAEAKLNIFLLVALGTVDAALDFWCVFLFGLTNLKITKGVRIDTFAAILKQEIAFFDFTKSGDLASRLNSDCGEMGYDLTWFFRFSIESIVRIVSIVSYMLWRSPRLGACAISVVSLIFCYYAVMVTYDFNHFLINCS